MSFPTAWMCRVASSEAAQPLLDGADDAGRVVEAFAEGGLGLVQKVGALPQAVVDGEVTRPS
jgi:hypothetical protein